MLSGKTHHKYRVNARYSLKLSNGLAGESSIIRKAQALKLQLEKMPVYIQNDELIVGGRTVFDFPRYLTEKEKKDSIPLEKEGYDYIFDRVYNHCQDERGWGSIEGICPGHRNVLTKGMTGIRREALTRMHNAGSLPKVNKDFWRAVVIVCDAVCVFAQRHADEARRISFRTNDPVRKKALEEIAAICARVPAQPPATFREALQAIWFIHMTAWLEGHYIIPLGRFDSYVYPYYQADCEAGRLTPESALELIECLWIKLNCDSDMTHTGIKGDTGQTMTLGGLNSAGRDSTNEVSYLCLQASRTLRKSEPQLCVRVHPGTSERFLKESLGLVRDGLGMPIFCNDDAIVPALVKDGYARPDALDYSLGGCWEITVAGKANDRTNSGRVNFLRALEWTLNNGRCFRTGKRDGMTITTADKIRTFNMLKNILKRQVAFYVKRIVDSCEKARFSFAPFLSATMDDCLKKGRDISSGGAEYNNTGILCSGIANTADALVVIEKLVYRDRLLSLKDLLDMLLKNYEGREDLRQVILNRFPRFGNDDDSVDLIAKELAEYFIREVKRYANKRGGRFRPMLASSSDFVSSVKTLGASADGRRQDNPFGSNFSAAPGKDRSGPTALMLSAAKTNQRRASMGVVIDIRFHPTAVRGEKGLSDMISLIRTYFRLSGLQIQFNVVDDKILKEAQKNPRDYQDLMVRVYGFSTLFVSLEKDMQNQIITRTAHGL